MYKIIILITLIFYIKSQQCQPCYYPQKNENCQLNPNFKQNKQLTLYVSIYPKLAPLTHYKFDQYYSLNTQNPQIANQFTQNHFSSIKDIYNTALKVLIKSKKYRQQINQNSQKGRRVFINNELFYFKHWYMHLQQNKQNIVKQLLISQYWEILNGGFIEQDQLCVYYQDIIQNYQIGLHFLYENFNYLPKISILNSQYGKNSISNIAMLSQMGIQGLILQNKYINSKENKKQFIWKVKSSNNKVYGILPTFIRHQFKNKIHNIFLQEQINSKVPICQSKQKYIQQLRKQNRIIKQIYKNKNIFQYFGNDLQQFDENSYQIIQSVMQQYSRQKCQKVIALYTNPKQYFKLIINKISNEKQLTYHQKNILPISNNLQQISQNVNHYTFNPHFKKYIRDNNRFLHVIRKIFVLQYTKYPLSKITLNKYQILQQYSQLLASLQNRNIFKKLNQYSLLDYYQQKLQKYIKLIYTTILPNLFQSYYTLYTENPIIYCGIFQKQQCILPDNINGDLYLKIFNSATRIQRQPIVIHLPQNIFYIPNCQYQIICLCFALPCNCQIYLYPQIYTFTQILLKRTHQNLNNITFIKQLTQNSSYFSYNSSHIKLGNKNGKIEFSYKNILQKKKNQNDKNETNKSSQNFRQVSKINKIYYLSTKKITKYIIKWQKQGMKTIISTFDIFLNTWKIQTLYSLSSKNDKNSQQKNLYMQISTQINNKNKFYVDSNGWLISQQNNLQQLQININSNENYKIIKNMYPMTAFMFIQDHLSKLSINTDRTQGINCHKNGKILINIDTVQNNENNNENIYRSQYKKYNHYITLQKSHKNQKAKQKQQKHLYRIFQLLYDQPLFIQINQIQPNIRIQKYTRSIKERNKWNNLVNIDNIKLWIRPWNDSSITLRIQNIYDDANVKIGLFYQNISLILSMFYGNQVNFTSIQQYSLSGNIKYEQLIQSKWNIKNIKNYSQIFNKKLGENIQLRPLQIRTFKIKGFSIVQCQNIKKIKLKHSNIQYKLNTKKQAPIINKKSQQLYKIIKNYLNNDNHCTKQSPILYRQTLKNLNPSYTQLQSILMKEKNHKVFQNSQQLMPSSFFSLYTEQIMPQDQHQNQIQYYHQGINLQNYKFDINANSIKKDLQNITIQFSKLKNSKLFKLIRSKVEKMDILKHKEKELYFYYKKLEIIKENMMKNKS